MGWGRNERVCSLTVGVWAGDEGSECVEGGAAQCAASVCVCVRAAGVVYNEKLSPSFLRASEGGLARQIEPFVRGLLLQGKSPPACNHCNAMRRAAAFVHV